MGRFRGCDLCGRQIIPSSIYWRVTLKDGTELKVCDMCMVMGHFTPGITGKSCDIALSDVTKLVRTKFKSRVEGEDERWMAVQMQGRPPICINCGKEIPLNITCFWCNTQYRPIPLCGNCVRETGGYLGDFGQLLLKGCDFAPPLE